MTREERSKYLNQLIIPNLFDNSQESCELRMKQETALRETIEELKQEPCEDCISRQAVNELVDELARAISDERCCISRGRSTATIMRDIFHLPSVTPQPKMGKCKDCKYFEYDSLIKVKGTKLIFAHEVCSMWGDGCKTKEDGYCFLFEPKMQEVEE